MGTNLRVLDESFQMNTKMTGFRWFSKIFEFLCSDESSLSIGRVKKSMPWARFLQCRGTVSTSYSYGEGVVASAKSRDPSLLMRRSAAWTRTFNRLSKSKSLKPSWNENIDACYNWQPIKSSESKSLKPSWNEGINACYNWQPIES